MRARIGLAVGFDTVRVIVLKGGRVVWAGETQREPGPPSPDELAALLMQAPLPRWPRPVLAAAVGPHASQAKLLEGLPPTDDADVLAAIVRERPSAFFLQNGAPLCTTGARIAARGSAWVAAVEASYVLAIRQACIAGRVDLTLVAPSAVLLPLGVRGGHGTITDGPVAVEIDISESSLSGVRRVPSSLARDLSNIEIAPALAAFDTQAQKFVDAYSAAIAPLGDCLTLGPAGDVPWQRRQLIRRVLPPLLLGSVSAAAILLSPLVPLALARHAESALRDVYTSEEWLLATRVAGHLQRVTEVLEEIDRFTATSPRRTHLLADLTRALPDSAAIERIDLRDNEAKLVVVALSAASVVDAVARLPTVSTLSTVGEVTPVVMNGLEFARITLTFDCVPDRPAADETEVQ